MTHPTAKDRLQRLLDVAGDIMEAAYQDRDAAHAAIKSLEKTSTALEQTRGAIKQTCQRIEQRVDAHAAHARTAIDQSAARVADDTARLLSEKFTAADAAADAAAIRYQEAASRITWKLAAAAAAVIIAVLAAAWLIVRLSLPSQAEIDALHASKAHLDADVGQLQRQIAELEKKGGRVQWTYCQDRRGAKHLCFRTDERGSQKPFTKGDETYRIPLGY